MEHETLAILMFPTVFVLLLLGFQVSLSLIVTGIGFGLALYGERIGIHMFNVVQDTATSFVLTAVAPFILMGCILERCGIAERLFGAMELLVGRLPGGLALASMAMATMIAATTGIVGAVEVMIGMMAIPSMRRQNYPHDLIAGTICAGGSLGTMIPPSLVLIVYASVPNISVGKLFSAALIPGIIMVGLFMAYIFLRGLGFRRQTPAQRRAPLPFTQALGIVMTGLFPAIFLVVAVLGAIFFGIASPTEAASLGCLGAVILSLLYRTLRPRLVIDAMANALRLTSMILLIVVGGSLFSSVFRALGGNDLVATMVDHSNLPDAGLILLLLGIVFIAGFILEWVSVLLICLPLFVPLIDARAIDPIWFAMMVFVILQSSYLTPPMAPSIFYLRGIAPADIRTPQMYLGVVPFILCQLLVLAMLMLFPALATWAPSVMVTGF